LDFVHRAVKHVHPQTDVYGDGLNGPFLLSAPESSHEEAVAEDVSMFKLLKIDFHDSLKVRHEDLIYVSNESYRGQPESSVPMVLYSCDPAHHHGKTHHFSASLLALDPALARLRLYHTQVPVHLLTFSSPSSV
jgi:hypothetical protein